MRAGMLRPPPRGGAHLFRHPVPHSRSRPRATDAARRVAGMRGNLTPMQTAPRQHEAVTEVPTDPLKTFITTRLARGEMPAQIADEAKIYLGIAVDRAQVIPN